MIQNLGTGQKVAGRNKNGRFVKGHKLTIKWKICDSCSENYYGQNASFCSRKCAGKYFSVLYKGKKMPIEIRQKISRTNKKNGVGKWMTGRINEKNPAWKGDSVGYQGLHAWISRRLGKPNMCENCNTSKKRMYHWANISGLYKRNLKDWMRLCVPCHHNYDNSRIA